VSSSTLQIQTPRKFLPLLGSTRYKGIHGGRGSGKSHFFAELLVERCILEPGTRAACVREVQKSLKHSVKLLVEDKIRTMGVQASFEILDAEIRTPGGGVIIFQGMQNHTADSIKSLEGFDICWIEEAQSISQRSLDMLRPTFRKAGSEIWASWNPNKPTDPIDVLLRGEQPPKDAVVIEANYSDNPWFPAELKADMDDDRNRDPDKWLHVWGGGYAMNSEARVFRNWKIEAFEPDPRAVFRGGADWGFAIDPTVLIKCYVEGRKLYVCEEAWKVGCEIDHTPALFETVKDARKLLIRADNARPETVSYMRRAGFAIVPSIKGPGSIEDGIEFLRSFDIIVHPKCKHTAEELTLFSYKTDPQTGELLPVLDDKNNHTIDALRYALEELRRSGYRPQEVERKVHRSDYGINQPDDVDWQTV
jgi:phage terminase large subunit